MNSGNVTSTPFFLRKRWRVPVLLLFAAPAPIFADTPGVAREADKAEAIKRIMARKTFFPREPEKPFCSQFLRDFRTLKGMRFAEPVARAATYDAPILQPYKARCGEQPLNETFACDTRGAWDVEWSKDWKERRQQYRTLCRAYYGTANFKVFELDINNDPKDGKELIVHFERAYGTAQSGEKTYWEGRFNVFDGSSCDYIGGAFTHDPYDYFWKQPMNNYNGIISYRGRYYIFDLFDLAGSDRDPKNPNYDLQVSTVSPDRSHWCSYSTIPLTTKPKKQGGAK